MPASQPVQHQLYDVLEPIVRDAGFELDDVDVRVVGHRHTVKLVIDSDSGVGLDDIAMLSRAASDELDGQEHLIGVSYTLEVTSPGAERALTLPRHWRRAHLRKVVVRTADGTEFAGRVGTAGDGSVTVLVDGERRKLRYADVVHAAVEVEFTTPPASEVAALTGGAPATPARKPGNRSLAEEPS